MSGAFTGFSETDIRNVQNGLSTQKQAAGKHVKLGHRIKKSVKPTVRFDDSHLNNTLTIPEEAKLCKSEKILEPKEDIVMESKAETISDSSLSTQPVSVPDKEEIKQTRPLQGEGDNICKMTETETKVDIEELKARQKLIEEQNRRRKELIEKALVDKKKRTLEETRRLNEIQKEFKKLDTVLSNDVKLLRKKIEIASYDYMEAQKRYLRIEKEFLDAKLALHQKLEKKELLTEHLSRIIEQNEERKAEKLTELLNKLEMGDMNNDLEDCRETDQ